jgi:hypothetical protein
MKPSYPWLMLISRSLLFLAFQLIFAMGFSIAGNPDNWLESTRWWVFVVILANVVSIFLLVKVFAAEGKRYLDNLRFARLTIKQDLLWLVATSVIGMPIAAAPMYALGNAIFSDRMIPVNMMFRPLPEWAFLLGLLFPLTIAFAELPTYFGYVLPRLTAQLNNGWLVWLLASLGLAVQHCCLPLLFDGRFILWRLGMYLPFALFAGLLLKLRPGLLPYFVIIHGLIDISTLSVYLMV